MSAWFNRDNCFLTLVAIGLASAAQHLACGGSSESERTKEAMPAVGAAVYQWQVLHGDSICPSIRQLVDGRFLDARARKADAWEQPYTMTCMDTGVIVTSFGPDRKRGTPDDIALFSPRITPKSSK
jgi:hypothetical protein